MKTAFKEDECEKYPCKVDWGRKNYTCCGFCNYPNMMWYRIGLGRRRKRQFQNKNKQNLFYT